MTQLAYLGSIYDEIGKLLPKPGDPAYPKKIDSAARYLIGHVPTEKWFETMQMVGDQYVKTGSGVRYDVLHHATLLLDKKRRTWKTVGVAGIGLSIISIGITIWAANRPCPVGGR